MTEFFGLERHLWAFLISGIVSLITIIISIHSIIMHIKYNSDPVLRKYILIIVGIVPVYSFISFLGLLDKNYTYALDALRECYEAFVIHAFYVFLLAYLSKGKNHLAFSEELQQKNQETEHRPNNHLFPMKYCLNRWAPGKPFLLNTMLGVFQYIIIKLLGGFAIFILAFFDAYTPGHFKYNDGYVYIVAVSSFSQMWAMYCLVMFYHEFKQELAQVRPLAKFICIKSVVFLTFWQGVLIAILVKIHIITETETYTTEQSSEGLQDFIICLEMFIAAFAHKYAFRYNEFYDPGHISAIYESTSDYLMQLIWPSFTHDKHEAADIMTDEPLATVVENGRVKLLSNA
jgi:Ca2+/Na+ antiporter